MNPINPEEARVLIDRLSPAELQIVKHISLGCTSEQTCHSLSILEGTYRSHKTRIKKKMDHRPAWGWPAVLIAALGTNWVDACDNLEKHAPIEEMALDLEKDKCHES